MITKIKKAIVGAVLNSDTFKSTLENIVSEEVDACVENSDDLVTDDRLDRALRDLGYDYDIPDKDEVREIVAQELDNSAFIESSEAEDIALELLKAEDIQVCSAEKLRVACLRTLANLIESAE